MAAAGPTTAAPSAALPASMAAITFHGVSKVMLSTVPTPKIQEPTDAIVKVTLCSICGSDLHPFTGRESGLQPGTVVGHEFVGTVVALGSACGGGGGGSGCNDGSFGSLEGSSAAAETSALCIGDRVMSPFTACCGECFFCTSGATCRCSHAAAKLFGWVSEGGECGGGCGGLHGSQAQYVRVPLAESTLVRLPGGVSDEVGILLGDILSTAYFCAESAGVSVPLRACGHPAAPAGTAAEPAQTEHAPAAQKEPAPAAPRAVVVVGCGPVGLLAVLLAKRASLDHLWAIDTVPERLAMAAKLGATPLDVAALGADGVVAKVRAATGGRGADAALELVGGSAPLRLAFDVLRPGGALSSIGVNTDATLPFGPAETYDKNLRFSCGRCPARSMMSRLLPLAQADDFDPACIITHRLPLSQGVHGYDIFSRRADGCIKVVLDPWA